MQHLCPTLNMIVELSYMKREFVVSLIAAILVLQTSCRSNLKPTSAPDGVFAEDPTWTLTVDAKVISSPATDGSSVFIRTERQLIAVDLSGNTLWMAESRAKQSLVPPLEIANDVILVPEENGYAAAFSAKSGHLLWRKCNSCEDIAMVTSIAVLDRTVFITRQNDQLAAYDIQTGNPVWENIGSVRVLPNVITSQDKVILTVADALYFLDSDDGHIEWQTTLSHERIKAMVTDDTTLYMVITETSGENPRIQALDIVSRTVIWEAPYPSDRTLPPSYLTLNSSTLYVTSGNVLLALSAVNGQTQWEFTSPSALERPIVSDFGMVLIRNRDLVYAIDRTSGDVMGSLPVAINGSGVGKAEISPLVMDRMIVVPIDEMTINAYLFPEN